jgi:hypothetical protein
MARTKNGRCGFDLGSQKESMFKINDGNPAGEGNLGRLAALLAPYRPLRVCASLAPCHPAQLAFARYSPVFQQTPKRGVIFTNRCGRECRIPKGGPDTLVARLKWSS